jgi:hypothetical protein
MKKAAAQALAAAMAVMSVASVAMADGYGTAGCGLGSIVFGDKPGMIQILAATTNGTSANQTFAITSGTSNCGSSEVSEASAKAFVETNREALAKDAAKGKGETIASLATLAGCSDAAAVGATLQSNFSTIFPQASVTDQQVGLSVVETLKAHPELSCKQLG